MNSDPSIVAALAGLRTRRDALDRAIAALEAIDGPPTADSGSRVATSAAPRVRKVSHGGGAAGARAVLEAHPGQGFDPSELAAAMERNGWDGNAEHPDRAARAAGNRLRRTPDSHVFLERGRFVYRPPSTTPLGFEDAEGGDDAAA